jgi:hypothetical protein
MIDYYVRAKVTIIRFSESIICMLTVKIFLLNLLRKTGILSIELIHHVVEGAPGPPTRAVSVFIGLQRPRIPFEKTVVLIRIQLGMP